MNELYDIVAVAKYMRRFVDKSKCNMQLIDDTIKVYEDNHPIKTLEKAFQIAMDITHAADSGDPQRIKNLALEMTVLYLTATRELSVKSSKS